MAVYIDTGREDEAARAFKLGWVKGVTTNPKLLAQNDIAPEKVLERLARISPGPVFYQLMEQDIDSMLLEANLAREIVGHKLVLKIVPTPVGYQFCNQNSKLFPCCITAVFSIIQAVIARESGAQFVAVYFQRISDNLDDAVRLVGDIAALLSRSRTEILAASLKTSEQVGLVLVAGAHHLAVPYDVIQVMMDHDCSTEAINKFNTDGAGIRLPSRIE